MHSATSTGSRKTYEQAWNHFWAFSTRYCGTVFPQLPQSVSDIVLLVAKKLAPSTISTYIFALSYVHKIGSFSDPTKAFVVQKITTAQSRLCSKPDKRLPVTRSQYYINWCWLQVTPSRPPIRFYYSKQCFSWLLWSFSSGWTHDQDPMSDHKGKGGRAGLVRVPLFWKSHC